MMKMFKEFTLMEAEKTANKELRYSIDVINQAYNEWKKIKRRINAVNIITTTANKLSTISPAAIDRIHEASRVKLTSLLIRCMDLGYWKPLAEKAPVYKKLYPLIEKVKNYDGRTGTGGTVKETILTRLSAAQSYQNKLEDGSIVFVAYEPKITPSYQKYLFGSEVDNVVATFKMQTLEPPQDYASLLETLRINHNKAVEKYKKSVSKRYK